MSSVDELTDEQLVRESRLGGEAGERCREILFERSYEKVARWCLRIVGDRDAAADIAQEVFMRVHQRLDSFRLESRFSTWLYVVTRSVAINKSQSKRRRSDFFADGLSALDPRDAAPDPQRLAVASQEVLRLRRAVRESLDGMEAKILHLHFVEGLTLPAITDLLRLSNKSGAKAYIVAGKRKIKRALGETKSAPPGASAGGGSS